MTTPVAGALRIAAALVALAGAAESARSQPASGQTIYAQCAACHSTDGTSGVGPTLKGIWGRKAGSVAGFRYSRAMRQAKLTWTRDTLDAYLRSPQDFLPGNVMPFAGIADPAQRAALIDYLRQLK